MDVPILGQPNGAPNGKNLLGYSADDLAVKELNAQGPQIRLLFCFNCKTIEELPDFEGRPENDHLLQVSLERHQSAGVPHTGHLFKVAVKLWQVESVRKAIIKQMREGAGGMSDFDPDFYNTKSTFYEDAMKCYAQHLRPKDSCPDFKDSKKRLVPKTAAERKDLGLPTAAEVGGPKVYLCDFCPMKSVVLQKQRLQAGVYDK